MSPSLKGGTRVADEREKHVEKLSDNMRALHEAAGVELPDNLATRAPTIFVGRDGSRPPVQKLIKVMVDVLRHKGIYKRGTDVGTIDPISGTWETMSPLRFVSWVPESGVMPVSGYGKNSGIPVEGEIGVEQARLILASTEFKVKLPEIETINFVRMPVMRDELDEHGDLGELAQDKRKGFRKIELLPYGFDAETKTFTIRGGPSYAEDMDPDEAYKWLNHLLEYFSWADKDRMAVQLAAMFSAYGRFLYSGKSPFFLWNSNLPGSGKSRLTELVLRPVFGQVGGEGYDQQDKQELKKTLDKVAQGFQPYLWFDDLDRIKLRSPHLNRWATIGMWEGRVMGTKEGFKVPIRPVTCFTGNQVTMDDNLARRTLQVDLFARQQAKDRVLPPDAVMIEDDFFNSETRMGEVLACLWALIRHWDVFNRQPHMIYSTDKSGAVVKVKARPLESFEGWSRVIPAIVCFANFGNPLAPFESPDAGDQDTRDFRTLAKALIKAHCTTKKDGEDVLLPSAMVTMRDIVRCARLEGLFADKLWTLDQVMELLLERERTKKFQWKNITMEIVGGETMDRAPEEHEKRDQAAQWTDRAIDSSWSKFFRKAAVAGQYFPSASGVLYEFGDRSSSRGSKFALRRVTGG